MKYIKLTQGKRAIVDDADYRWLKRKKWHCAENHNGNLYAVDGNGKLMHRKIMGNPKRKQIDHINHNGLDDRKINLRIVTPKQNSMNRESHNENSKSKERGVYYSKYAHQWRVQIGRKQYGTYETFKDAKMTMKYVRQLLKGD